MRGVLIGAVWMVAAGVAMAQQPQQQPAADGQKQCTFTASTSDGEKVTGTRPCAGQPQQAQPETPATKRFPYPGEAGAMDAQDGAKQPAQQNANQPGANQPDANQPATKKFPFPGEAAPAGDNGGLLKDAGSSGESSSSSTSTNSPGDGGSSSSASGLPPSPDDVDSDTPVAPKRGMHKKPPPPPKDIATQEAEDLQVAGFYMNDKNWRGAYGRAQEAVKLVDEDADAHLALAEAARKLGRMDEAAKEYKRTLALDPVPKSRKAAEKALKEMAGS